MFVKSHTDETKNEAESEINSNKSSFALAFHYDKRRRQHLQQQQQQQGNKYFNIILFAEAHTNTTASVTLSFTHRTRFK